MAKPIAVSGIKPTGDLHIGNYLGMMKNAVALQNSNKYNCFYFIADYHALTQRVSREDRMRETLDIAAYLLAVGINPKKSTLFIQSHVAGHTDLTWIFNCLTSMGELQRMVEYKEKLAEGHTPNVGLFDYPVLMAADILIYKAEAVPVGDDQRQHLELARETARRFNANFGKTFKEPRALTTQTPRVMSLDNPEKKMSKSVPSGCVFLQDSSETIAKKIMSATTDSLTGIKYEPESRPGISNLVLIYSEFSGQPISEIEKRYENIGYADFKRDLARVIVKELHPIQKEYKAIIKKKAALLKALKNGAARAEKVTAKTMAEVRKKVGLI